MADLFLCPLFRESRLKRSLYSFDFVALASFEEASKPIFVRMPKQPVRGCVENFGERLLPARAWRGSIKPPGHNTLIGPDFLGNFCLPEAPVLGPFDDVMGTPGLFAAVNRDDFSHMQRNMQLPPRCR